MAGPQAPAVLVTARDTLRSKILNQKVGSKIVTLDDGLQIEVRQSKVGEMLDAIADEDLKKRMAKQLIMCCYVPGSQDKVFEDADYEVLMDLPSGGYYRQLIDAINEFSIPKAVDAAKKLGEQTPTSG